MLVPKDRQILGFYFYENNLMGKCRETESRPVAEGGDSGECLLMGARSLSEMTKVF